MATPPKKGKQTLDNTDIQILALLYQNARLSNKELAAQVGLAASSCLERVKRLQSENVILGTSLQLNLNILGGHIQAMIAVRLSSHSRETVNDFKQALLPKAEVVSLYHMGGENDFLVHVSVRDTGHLQDFVFNAITARSEVNHVETALIYDYQNSQNLPVV